MTAAALAERLLVLVERVLGGVLDLGLDREQREVDAGRVAADAHRRARLAALLSGRERRIGIDVEPDLAAGLVVPSRRRVGSVDLLGRRWRRRLPDRRRPALLVLRRELVERHRVARLPQRSARLRERLCSRDREHGRLATKRRDVAWSERVGIGRRELRARDLPLDVASLAARALLRALRDAASVEVILQRIGVGLVGRGRNLPAVRIDHDLRPGLERRAPCTERRRERRKLERSAATRDRPQRAPLVERRVLRLPCDDHRDRRRQARGSDQRLLRLERVRLHRRAGCDGVLRHRDGSARRRRRRCRCRDRQRLPRHGRYARREARLREHGARGHERRPENARDDEAPDTRRRRSVPPLHSSPFRPVWLRPQSRREPKGSPSTVRLRFSSNIHAAQREMRVRPPAVVGLRPAFPIKDA